MMPAGIGDKRDIRQHPCQILRPDPVTPDFGMIVVAVKHQVIGIFEIPIASAVVPEFDEHVIIPECRAELIGSRCPDLVAIDAVLRVAGSVRAEKSETMVVV